MAEDSKEVAQVAKVETIQERPQQVAQPDHSVEAFISQAIDKQLPIETIERFLAMRKELRQDQAREAYVRAMSQLQGELPTIKKLKNNSGTSSKYAPLEDIVSQTKLVISKHHFSYNWDTITTEDVIKVTCKATHADGHVETSEMVSKIAEGTRANSEPQKAAITITYLKRYTLCNLFGIVVADEDMDARNEQSNPTPKLPVDPKAKIVALMRQLGHSDPNSMKDRVIEFTQLDPNDPTNTQEIVDRLSVLLSEMDNENN